MATTPTHVTPKCLFCEQQGHTSTAFEDTVFNNKTFEYIQCTHCGLVYVTPMPNDDDLIKMYPVEYQGELVLQSLGNYTKLLDRIKNIGKFETLLDYGCGGGRFVAEAVEAGFTVTGTEYNPELVRNLSATQPRAAFCTIEDFYKGKELYDLIFLSNVLEHLTNPKEIMLKLKPRLAKNGLFVLEGPVEYNFNLTKYVRLLIFWLRKNLWNKKANHTPTHVLYSNKQNQEAFFKSIGLETLYYHIDEGNWPFPSSYKASDTIMKKLMYFIARTSVKIGKNFSFWGNNFVYIGKVKE